MKYTTSGESRAANMWSVIFVTRDKTLTKTELYIFIHLQKYSINQMHFFEIYCSVNTFIE